MHLYLFCNSEMSALNKVVNCFSQHFYNEKHFLQSILYFFFKPIVFINDLMQ